MFPINTQKVFRQHIIGGLLSTRLQQAVLHNSIKGKCEGLEVEGCGSSVVRALMAKAGPGFESPATTNIFFTFSFAFFQTPSGDKVSI